MWEDFPTGCAAQKPLPKTETMARNATLRDYFAAAALQGICSTLAEAIAPRPDAIARDVYKIADAMIAERSKA